MEAIYDVLLEASEGGGGVRFCWVEFFAAVYIACVVDGRCKSALCSTAKMRALLQKLLLLLLLVVVVVVVAVDYYYYY